MQTFRHSQTHSSAPQGGHLAQPAAQGSLAAGISKGGGNGTAEKTLGGLASEGEFQLFGGLMQGLFAAVPGRGIQHQTIGGHHSGHIFGALHPTFYFKADHPGLDQLGKQFEGREVAGGEVVAGLLLQPVTAAAGLGAAPPVAAHPAERRGEKALAGDGEAEGTVDKMFQLHAALLADPADFGQGEFTGQHRPAEPHLLQHSHSGSVMDGHLGGGVERQPGKMAAGQTPDPQILDDDPVGIHLLQGCQNLDHPGQFTLFEQGVEGNVEPPPLLVGVSGHSGRLGQAEILGLGAGGELLQAAIDRIGPVLQGGEKCLQTPGRSQQFGGWRC